jgi:hypothetical protein
VIFPSDIINKGLSMAKILPYWLDPIMTSVLRSAHSKGWRKEAAMYDKEDDELILQLNEAANENISWALLKDQVLAMSDRCCGSGQIEVAKVTAVCSEFDDQIDNDSMAKSLRRLFRTPVHRVNIPTAHSTLAYQPELWGQYLYK